MPYVVYHGDHVWGWGHTPNSAVKDAKNHIDSWNSGPNGNRKLVPGMYMLYITKTLLNRLQNYEHGGHLAARYFKFTERKFERTYVRVQ